MGTQSKIALAGFIGNTHDALIVFEACRRGLLPRATGRLSEEERKAIKSGDIYVFNVEESQIKRWTDGKRWSPSRILNNFLIYREIKSDSQDEEPCEDGAAEHAKAENEEIDELAPSTSATPAGPSVRSTSALQSSPNNITASRTVDPKLRNITGGLELLPNRKEGGLIKKTISVAGLHMISYYTAEDVISGRLRQPGSLPELANLDISHPFLMAQFFRHPPQVTFDADQMPHFAGITDDEPMVRKPTAQPRRKKEQSEQSTPGSHEAPLPGPSHMPIQNVSHNPPFLTTLPPRTSLSPIGQSQPHSHHMISSPIQRHDQTFSSTLSHMSTDVNPLLPPLRPGTGSRSNTSLSAASTSDTSSPRIRSAISHNNRHEPYRIPLGRHRYSIPDISPPIPNETASPAYAYPRQGSLPNPGMDYYRPGMHQASSSEFATPQSRSMGYYSAPLASASDSSHADYGYSLSTANQNQHAPWTTMQQVAPGDSPRSFYSTVSSSIQAGQLATGEPPHTLLHSPNPASMYSGSQIPQPDYAHPTLYSGPDFYGRTPVSMDVNHNQVQPWYGQVSEEQAIITGGVQPHTQHAHNPDIVAPQAVQHLAGFLPETGYSPLLPSSAAYASEHAMQGNVHNGHAGVKHEPSSPGKKYMYGHPQGAYITAPPPPSYTHPAHLHQEDNKPSQLSLSRQEPKQLQGPEYPSSGSYDQGLEDPRDS